MLGTGHITPPFLTSALVGGKRSVHAPTALPTRKEPLVSNGEEAGWALESVYKNDRTKETGCVQYSLKM
jgi:hypothetical protein